MTASDLQQLLVSALVRAHGGTRQRWRRAVGDIRVYSLDTHPHCNWDVRASGSPGDIDAVDAVVDALRDDHPHIARDWA